MRIPLALLLLLSTVPAVASVLSVASLELHSGEQRTLQRPAPVTRLSVGDPKVADVQVTGERQILVTAKLPGSTSILIWYAHGAPDELRVAVSPSSMLGATLAYDTQVQIDIKVVETSRQVMRLAGVQGGKNDEEGVIQIAPPGLLAAITRDSASAPFFLQSASGFLPWAAAFNLVYGDSDDGLLAVISVLEAHGLAYVLAEPSLVAMSGHTASFLAGGEFPVPVVQNAAGSEGAISIQYKEFGVRVNLTPTVLSSDRIALKVAPEVSELDFSAGVTTAGVSVPALRTRRADTTVELGDGETFAIGGLVSRGLSAAVDKIPFFGDIPVLGSFFKSTRFGREDKELLMLVSPRLVRPIARGVDMPPLPADAYRHYDPNAWRLFFLEAGEFRPSATGFDD